jgi:hypothetical protein
MPSTRPKLILDEDSFQGLLAAAYTIQQYNEREGGIDAALSAELNATMGATALARRTNAGLAPSAIAEPEPDKSVRLEPARCLQCGAPLPPGGAPCPACDAEVFRPGEKLQRTWATMWSISQEQELPEHGLPEPDLSAAASAPQSQPGETSLKAIKQHVVEQEMVERKSLDQQVKDRALDDDASPRILPVDAGDIVAASSPARFKVRFRRADLYLGLAVIVALLALFWPSASAGRSELQPWERVLVAMGIAEAPAAAQAEVHYSGDPNIKVWVDTSAALYYCPGDELYGKSPGGYYTTQHDAQLDRFEPALRRACVP